MKRKVNQDIPHDWTDWFDAEPPDHPLSEVDPEVLARARKDAVEVQKMRKAYLAEEAAARPEAVKKP